MATAIAKNKPTTVVIDKEYVSLDLDQNEVVFILSVLERIGGDPCHSMRKHAPAISDAIRKAACPETLKMARRYSDSERMMGTIHCQRGHAR